MIIDIDAEHRLVFTPNGQDGVVIIAMKTGRMVTVEERDGMIWFDGQPTTLNPTLKPRP